MRGNERVGKEREKKTNVSDNMVDGNTEPEVETKKRTLNFRGGAHGCVVVTSAT